MAKCGLTTTQVARMIGRTKQDVEDYIKMHDIYDYGFFEEICFDAFVIPKSIVEKLDKELKHFPSRRIRDLEREGQQRLFA